MHIKYTYTYSEAIAKNRRRAAGKCALESIHAFSLFRVGQAESGNVSVAANAAADCAGPAYCAAQPQHQQGKPVEHWSSAGMNQLHFARKYTFPHILKKKKKNNKKTTFTLIML